MEYVEHQVRLSLATAIAERDPLRHSTARETAAKKLVDDFLALAERQGLERGVSARQEPYFALSSSLSVRLMADGGGGTIGIRVDGWGGSSTPIEYVPLTFDYIAGTFVGKDIDHDIAPTPGEPLPRVSPLVTIARTVAAEIAKLKQG